MTTEIFKIRVTQPHYNLWQIWLCSSRLFVLMYTWVTRDERPTFEKQFAFWRKWPKERCSFAVLFGVIFTPKSGS